MKQKKIKKCPIVSVVIPIYNGASYLREAVISVQKSLFKNFEILLVDDGSTDTSKILCKKIAEQYENVTYYSFEENKGLGNVLNFALKKARGTYICRLNQDDIMLPQRIQLQVKYLEENPDVIAVGSYLTYFNQAGKTATITYGENDKDIRKMWYIVSPFADPAVMYKKDIACKAGGYKQSYWPAEDLHLWYRIGRFGKFANISTPLTKMRQHHNAASNRFFRTQIINTYKVHMWAHHNIKEATVYVRLYWFAQLISGLLFGPKLNWFLYKRVKIIISYAYLFFVNTTPKPTILKSTINVNPIPNTLNFSGS